MLLGASHEETTKPSAAVYRRAGCITFHYLQFGRALTTGIFFTTTNTSINFRILVWTCRVYSFHPQPGVWTCSVQGACLYTASSTDVQGVSLSIAS